MKLTLKLSGMALALAAVCPFVTGCLHEKTQVELQPNLSGKLHYEQTLGKQMSSMILGFGGMGGEGGGDPKEDMAAKGLASFEGIAAWTDVKVSTTDDKRIKVEATGWFKDISAVQRKSDEGGARFIVEPKDGATRIRFQEIVSTSGGGGPGGGPGEESLFDKDPNELMQQKAMTKGMLSGMIADLRQEVVLVVPVDPSDVVGFKQAEGKPRELTMVRSGADLAPMIDKAFDVAIELAPKIKAGEMTKAEAEAELKRRLETEATTELGATVKLGEAKADPEFQKAMDAAVAGWGESKWKKLIEEAKTEAPEFGEDEGGDGMPGDGKDEGDF